MPKLDDRWNLGLWLGKNLASDEHYVGTSAGVRRCQSTWRRPGKQRKDKKMLTELMVNRGIWCNRKTRHHRCVVCTSSERQIKCGGTKGCAACFGHAKVHSSECRARFQDIVGNEAASASEPSVETPGRVAGGSAPSSSGGPVPAAGRHALEEARQFCTKLTWMYMWMRTG